MALRSAASERARCYQHHSDDNITASPPSLSLAAKAKTEASSFSQLSAVAAAAKAPYSLFMEIGNKMVEAAAAKKMVGWAMQLATGGRTDGKARNS
jgi:hypothetical protein